MITGLAATAPVSIAVAAAGNAYVVNGLTRGSVLARVTTAVTAYPLGVTKAASISGVSVASPLYHYVSAVQIKDGGFNFRSPPSVTISGVTGAKAVLLGDTVADITIVTSATTHTQAPGVKISTTQQASNATAHAGMRGRVSSVAVNPQSGYYTDAPAVTLTAAAAVTEVRAAKARAALTYASFGATSGQLAGIIVTDAGEYTWNGASLAAGSAAVAATVAAPLSGMTPTLSVEVSAAVAALTVISGGTDYSSAPEVSFISNGPYRKGGGALANAQLNGKTSVDSLDLIAGGDGHDGGVSVVLSSDPAKAVTVLEPRMSGQYRLAARYVRPDGTPGDLCELVLVDCKDAASSISWALTSLSPPAGHTVELWRTSSDQAITLYRVTTLTPPLGSSYLDTLPDSLLTDPNRSGYGELPVLTAEGYPNAYRFGIPPSNMSVVTLFQDRAWYAVDTSLAEPNVIYFSSLGEHEAVPATNQLIIESTGRNVDKITGLMPMDGALYVGQRSHIVRVTTGDDPLTQATAVPVSQRGMLNDRCWDHFEGVAYIADTHGVHSFSGSASESLSDPVSTYFTSSHIDFSKAKWFFLRVNAAERVVRFYYTPSGSASEYPVEALCYSIVTKAWWRETYGKPLASGVRAQGAVSQIDIVGSSGKIYSTSSSPSDDGTAVPFSFRTGDFPLNKDPRRGVRLTYDPTPASQPIGLRLYYNDSSSPRPNAVASARGTGFTTDTGSTQAVLDMAATRSSLGTATGFAQASFAGRIDDNSSGADRSLSVEFAGTATSPIIVHSIDVEGVG